MARHIAISIIVVLVILIDGYIIFSIFQRHFNFDRIDPEARYGACYELITNSLACILMVSIGVSLLGAAIRWIASVKVKFGEACAIFFVSAFFAIPIAYCCMYLIPDSIIPLSHNPIIFCLLPVTLIVQIPVLKQHLSISFGKASLISLFMFVIFGILSIQCIAREIHLLRH